MMEGILLILTMVCLLLTTVTMGSTPDGNENINDVQFLEGDIILTSAQQKLLEASYTAMDMPLNAVSTFEENLWPNGVIPYVLDSNLSPNAVVAIHEAIQEYENKTCVSFKPRTIEDSDFVRFHDGYGCSSHIGRKGGQQDISIGRKCESKGVVIHEIFHALGRWHEQARYDRNLYIQIHTENIRKGFLKNFRTISPVFATTNGVPYDFDSIMHYSADAFSSNGSPTITPINIDIDVSRLGQRNTLSENDIAHITALYCKGNGQWSGWSSWSSCSRSCNGGRRIRTRTCIGGTSCLGMTMQTDNCNTEDCPLPPQWSEWYSWSACTALCGGGKRSRSRTCVNGTTCNGPSHEFEDCNQQNCSQTLVTWSTWSECSQSCKGGMRYRTKICENGGIGDCLKETREQQECNSNIDCEWSECSKQCGNGSQINFVTLEARSCNQHPCHNEICLKGISHIGCYYISDLLEGLLQFVDEASENIPGTLENRTEPIRKCAEKARSANQPLFAVSLKLCYIVTTDFESLLDKSTTSGICLNGTGNYFGSKLIGDVYRIVNDQEFRQSAINARHCGVDYCTGNESSCDIHSSGPSYIIRQKNSYLILSLVLIMILIFV